MCAVLRMKSMNERTLRVAITSGFVVTLTV